MTDQNYDTKYSRRNSKQVEKSSKQLIRKVIPWLFLLVLIFFIVVNWPRSSGRQALPNKGNGDKVLKIESQQRSPKPPKPQEAEVLVELLNFRSSPSSSRNSIVGTLAKGTRVKVIKQQGEWLEIELSDGRKGFITAKPRYIRLINEKVLP